MLSILLWTTLASAGFVALTFLVGKITRLDQQAQEEGRPPKWGIAINLFTWIMLSIALAREFNSPSIQASIVILGISIGIATEIYRLKSFRKQNDKSTKDTQW